MANRLGRLALKQRVRFFEEIRSRKGIIASDGKEKLADNGRLGDIDHGVKNGYFIDLFLETGFRFYAASNRLRSIFSRRIFLRSLKTSMESSGSKKRQASIRD